MLRISYGLCEIGRIESICDLEEFRSVLVEFFDASSYIGSAFSLRFEPGTDICTASAGSTKDVHGLTEIYFSHSVLDGREWDEFRSGYTDLIPFILFSYIDEGDICTRLDELSESISGDFLVHVIWR